MFRYTPKAMKIPPLRVCSIALPQPVRFVHVLRDGYLLLCFQEAVSIYQLDEHTDELKLHFRREFNMPPELSLLQVPEPWEDTVNIFLQEQLDTEGGIGLWLLSL